MDVTISNLSYLLLNVLGIHKMQKIARNNLFTDKRETCLVRHPGRGISIYASTKPQSFNVKNIQHVRKTLLTYIWIL